MECLKVTVRPVQFEEKDLVFSTWLKGNYYGCDYYRSMPDLDYYKYYSLNIQRLLDKPGTCVDVAETDGLILGYIVYNDQSLYWAYVKRDYRKQGVLKALIKNLDLETYTGNTPIGLSIGKRLSLTYNPMKEE